MITQQLSHKWGDAGNDVSASRQGPGLDEVVGDTKVNLLCVCVGGELSFCLF